MMLSKSMRRNFISLIPCDLIAGCDAGASFRPTVALQQGWIRRLCRIRQYRRMRCWRILYGLRFLSSQVDKAFTPHPERSPFRRHIRRPCKRGRFSSICLSGCVSCNDHDSARQDPDTLWYSTVSSVTVVTHAAYSAGWRTHQQLAFPPRKPALTKLMAATMLSSPIPRHP